MRDKTIPNGKPTVYVTSVFDGIGISIDSLMEDIFKANEVSIGQQFNLVLGIDEKKVHGSGIYRKKMVNGSHSKNEKCEYWYEFEFWHGSSKRKSFYYLDQKPFYQPKSCTPVDTYEALQKELTKLMTDLFSANTAK